MQAIKTILGARSSGVLSTAVGSFNFSPHITSGTHDPKDLASSMLLACVSGVVLAALHFASNDHDVRQFYARRDKRTYALYMACIFVVWFSFALNARYAAIGFARICFSLFG